MEVEHLSQQIRPFVYIQYPTPPAKATSFQATTDSGTQGNDGGYEQQDQQPPKRKRQQTGYACDKCRERRVGCDRGRPTCGQCDGKYHCVYSNHALRLDNVSMRQRMDDMQSTIKRMHDVLMRLEDDYRDTVPRILEQQTSQPQQQSSPPPPLAAYEEDTSMVLTDPSLNGGIPTDSSSVPPPPLVVYGQHYSPTIVDWANGTGWDVTLDRDGLTTIQTDITSYETLRDAVRRALQMAYQFQGPPMYTSPTYPENSIIVSDLPSFSVFETLGRIPALQQHRLPSSSTASTHTHLSSSSSSSSSTSTSSPSSLSTASLSLKEEDIDDEQEEELAKANTSRLLGTDVMSRLIQQHHQCGFPILVSPARFERHYQTGELKSVVLSSIFCHIAPHACIYHPHLVHLQDFRTLGERFYDHSRTQLGLDDQSNLSNIHQRTLLIAYDLDLGRVRRAFLHLGVAIRMCFALDLHRPEGYTRCATAFEREQAKRIFWTVWFFDSMVPHFFAQSSTIRHEDIKIELPCVLSDFDPTETEQTRFAISIIHIRRLHTEKSLRSFYKSCPEAGRCHRMGSTSTMSFWARRTYFCVLLDYCLLWINLYRPRLPRKSAIRRTSQAAFAMMALFAHWFRPDEHFDCFFRPYLYHYMCIIQIFKGNITQQDGPRSPMLVAQSKAAIVKLFHMYRTTPTHRSFAESKLEKDLLVFIQQHEILNLSQLQYGHHQDPVPECLDELVDDLENSDYYGWGIFAVYRDPRTASTATKAKGSSEAGSTSGDSTFSSSTSTTDSNHFHSMDYIILFVTAVMVHGDGRSITVKNNCPEKISVGVLTNGNSNPDERFDLNSQGSRTINKPESWGGRLFGQPSCVGADAKGPHCGNAGAANPATLAEFFFKGHNNKDYYDISLVDGYNIPASIEPQGGQGGGGDGKNCGKSDCKQLPDCPPNLAIKDGSGKVIGCQSSCSKTGDPQHCCVGQYDGPDKCKADKQAQNVKKACPDSYSFAYDDQTSTYACENPSGYTVTFC